MKKPKINYEYLCFFPQNSENMKFDLYVGVTVSSYSYFPKNSENMKFDLRVGVTVPSYSYYLNCQTVNILNLFFVFQPHLSKFYKYFP